MRAARTRLEQKIRERRQTFEEFAEYAKIFARDNKESGTLSVRHLQRLVAGRGPKGQPLAPPRPATARLLEHIFGLSIDELITPLPTSATVDDSRADLPRILQTSSRIDDAMITVRQEQRGGEYEPLPYVRPKMACLLTVSPNELNELLRSRPSVQVAQVAPAAGPEQPDNHVLSRGGLLLSVVIDGHPVLLPLDANVLVDHDRIVVDLDHASGRSDRMGDLMHAAHGRQARPDVDDLVDTDLGPKESHHTANEASSGNMPIRSDHSTLLGVAPEIVITHLQEQWHLLVRADNLFGPSCVLRLAHEQIELIESLLSGARGGVRTALLSLGAKYAESAAWLHEDAGEEPAAFWTSRSLEWAHAAGDHLLVAWALFRRSQQVATERDAAQVIGLARAAQDTRLRLPDQMRAAIMQQEAYGLALDGMKLPANAHWMKRCAGQHQPIWTATPAVATVHSAPKATSSYNGRRAGRHWADRNELCQLTRLRWLAYRPSTTVIAVMAWPSWQVH